MNIEESAFKDRKTLANLNTIDLLDIIEFLQLDRKQWINQFSKTQNESIDIQKENQELKKQLEYKYEKVGTLTSEILYEENTKLINQQKEFINFLEDNYKETQDIWYIKILQKYKEIIGVSDENN